MLVYMECGMGGISKITIAKFVYYQNFAGWVVLGCNVLDQSDRATCTTWHAGLVLSESKIIITTRFERLLKPHEVYEVCELGHDESIKFFSFDAFEEDHPIEGYIEYTKGVV
ncbi:hypothetical protein LguiA_018382 [Lonicera macranthoides]